MGTSLIFWGERKKERTKEKKKECEFLEGQSYRGKTVQSCGGKTVLWYLSRMRLDVYFSQPCVFNVKPNI